MLKPKFNVGDRVRVRIATDVIPEEEIENDIGTVVRVDIKFPDTEFERITYWVRLVGPYLKKGYLESIGPMVTISEGWNIRKGISTIERLES